jgi:hypothetical protein
MLIYVYVVAQKLSTLNVHLHMLLRTNWDICGFYLYDFTMPSLRQKIEAIICSKSLVFSGDANKPAWSSLMKYL